MTLEEWSTCKEAWWVPSHLMTPHRVVFTDDPPMPTNTQAICMRNAIDSFTKWNFIGEKYWYSTEAEAIFALEVLR